MIYHIIFFIHSVISIFKSDQKLYTEIVLLKKENLILKRKHPKQRFLISRIDKIIYVILNMLFNIKNNSILFSPGTIIKWQKSLIASFWTFMKKNTHPGRPPVPPGIKKLILEIKNNNLLWGVKKIRDELLKLDIKLHKKTIRNILRDFRKRGKVKKTHTWKKFLQSEIDSLFAMDYFTVDTVFNQRFYVHFIICHKTREIVQFAITQNPTLQFVKQQLGEFQFSIDKLLHLIHDRDSSFMSIDYLQYGIKDICTSIKSPNMNAIAERFVRSIRNEALDNFILFNQKQVLKIIRKYVEYYNFNRPHQGIAKIPKGKPPNILKSDFSTGNIRKVKVLGGLHHHYYRKVA